MIEEMKSHKSPGENEIPAELLKIGADKLTKRIYQLRLWQNMARGVNTERMEQRHYRTPYLKKETKRNVNTTEEWPYSM